MPELVTGRKLYSFGNPTSQQLLDALKPGDIILTTSIAETFRLVVGFQKRFNEFCPLAHSFSHAAIYVGQGMVVHSMPDFSLDPSLAGGVSETELSNLLTPNEVFVVLRSPLVAEAHYTSIIDAARGHVGVPYDYIGIVRSVMYSRADTILGIVRRITSIIIQKTQEAVAAKMVARGFVCSDFVFAVYDELFQEANPCNIPRGRPAGMCMPCELFANPNFNDVVIPVGEN